MSKNGRFSSVSRTVGVNRGDRSDRSKEIASETDLDLDHLDLERKYEISEFEALNDQLKTRPLRIKLDNSSEPVPIHHFELDKSGRLVPMGSTPSFKERRL